MAKKKKKTESKPILISIGKCSYIMNMSEPTLDSWLKEKNILVVADKHGQHCITYDSFKRLANDENKNEKSKPDVVKYLTDRERWDIEKMKNDIGKMNAKYKEYVKMLTEYHSELFNAHFELNNESPLCAALLLFIKIINMCNLFLDSVEKYNSSLLLIRTIDEANTLAQYFTVMQQDEQCKRDLIAWFRYEKSPSPAECREKLSIVLTALAPKAGIPSELLEMLTDEVYDVKSKSIHHSYRDCSELLELELKGDNISVKEVAYGSISVYRQFEVLEYFESIINNVLQGFLICFNNILSNENKKKLVELTTKMSFK
ncbi:MAG: hypothetical protein Q8M94_16475 [Ignavibacteria bacterium]|nr:hypothetical protein [Ignavibacteria bacterium]